MPGYLDNRYIVQKRYDAHEQNLFMGTQMSTYGFQINIYDLNYATIFFLKIISFQVVQSYFAIVIFILRNKPLCFTQHVILSQKHYCYAKHYIFTQNT